ncbi:MAG TPA: hypothetical protein VJ646_18005 [Candidatus Binatia bacterium]|nr:hypothetical protein [Candidatus Binatia bacterium]
MPLDDASAKRYARKSAFLEWCEKDGLSVIGGYGVGDLKTAPLKHWERWGGPAAYCHLEGSHGFVGVIVAEIPAGKSLKPITTRNKRTRHLALRRGLRYVSYPGGRI